jgi:hypothetical protein
VLASCNGRTVLLDSVSTGAESQTAEAQARTIEQVMVKNGGVEIFGGVASDNTSSSVNARDLLAEKNPGLVSLQDQSHAADLLLEDIGKLRWSKEIIESATFVSNYVRAKAKLRALHTARKTEYNKGENVRKGSVASAKSWKALCVTRFAYAHTLLTHAADSRLALRNTLECLEFAGCVNADSTEKKEKLAKFRKIVENSAFWDSVRDLASLMEPILVYLRHL